jgi:hypothetical protein
MRHAVIGSLIDGLDGWTVWIHARGRNHTGLRADAAIRSLSPILTVPA